MAKILAVDDSASMRGMVAFTLRGAGHDVSEAENGQLAVDAAKGARFDLVGGGVAGRQRRAARRSGPPGPDTNIGTAGGDAGLTR